jgi:hypothetical protein
VAGDFNNNGKEDLAILMEAINQVWIYTNEGQGHFTHTFSIDAGSNPTGLSVVKDSQSGKLDLLVGDPFGDVLRLVGNGTGTFAPLTGKGVPLAVVTVNGQTVVLLGNQQTNNVSVSTSPTGSTQFPSGTTLPTLKQQFGPSAVQLVKLEGPNSPFYDAVVVDSGSNSVLVYHGTSVNTFAPPVAYPVGTDPVSVTVAGATVAGVSIPDVNGDTVPDLLVANKGSNDVSELFGTIVNGQWRPVTNSAGLPLGPRDRSRGFGPVAVTVVPNANSPGGNDLAITNSDGTVSLLPGRGQGFFKDTNLGPPLQLGSPVTQAAFNGLNGVAVTLQGQLIGFNLENFTTQGIVFTPPAGHPVDAVGFNPNNGDVVVAEQGGSVEELGPNGNEVETFTALDGTPDSPSALEVLQTPTGEQVLVTNAGESNIFVFGFPSGGGVVNPGLEGTTFGQALMNALEQAVPGSTANATSPAGASLVLVVSLVADILPGGEGGVGANGAGVQATALAQLEQQAHPPQIGGEDAAGEFADEALAVDLPALGPAGGDTLRKLDLYRPSEAPDPLRPLSRQKNADAPTLERMLADLWANPMDGLGQERETPLSWPFLARDLCTPARTPDTDALALRQTDLVWLAGGPESIEGATWDVETPARMDDAPTRADLAFSSPDTVEGEARDEKWLLLAALATCGLNSWAPTDRPDQGRPPGQVHGKSRSEQ